MNQIKGIFLNTKIFVEIKDIFNQIFHSSENFAWHNSHFTSQGIFPFKGEYVIGMLNTFFLEH